MIMTTAFCPSAKCPGGSQYRVRVDKRGTIHNQADIALRTPDGPYNEFVPLKLQTSHHRAINCIAKSRPQRLLATATGFAVLVLPPVRLLARYTAKRTPLPLVLLRVRFLDGYLRHIPPLPHRASSVRSSMLFDKCYIHVIILAKLHLPRIIASRRRCG